MSRRSLAAALGVAAVCGSVGAVTIMSDARAATQIPITGLPGFGQVVVDMAAHRVFASESTNASNPLSTTPAQGIVVADLSGNYLTTIDAGSGAQGLTLGPDGQLYAALSTAGEVAQIDPATYSETDYPLPAGDVPEYVAAQSGKVWVSYDAGTDGAVGDVTPGATSSFEADSTLTPAPWTSAPLLAADPGNGGTLVAVTPGQAPHTVATFDVSGATPAVEAATTSLSTDCPSVATQIAVLPGGQQFTMSCGVSFTTDDPVFTTADLSESGLYVTPGGSGSIAVAPDGAVADGSNLTAGSNAGPVDIDVFAPDKPQPPAQSYSMQEAGNFGGYLAPGGLAWGDSTALAVVMGNTAGASTVYQLRVITYPLLTQTSLVMNFLQPTPLGKAISVSGSLSLYYYGVPDDGGGDPGQTVTISRSTPGGTPVQLGQVTTNSSGNFTFSDTPPALGSYTYTASFAGDSATAPATVTKTVTVLKPAQIALQLPPAVAANQSFEVNGVLTVNGAPAAGQTVTITRYAGAAGPPPTTTPTATATPTPTATGTPSPSATGTPSPSATGTASASPAVTVCLPLQPCGGTTIGQAVTDSDGAFTISDTPPAVGTYTYTASFAGDPATASATASATVTAVDPAQFTLQMPPTALPNQTIDASGWLSFASGASASGKTVTITRTNPDGTTTTSTVTTGTTGAFSFKDNPPALGTYTYTVTYTDSATGIVTGQASASVTVAKES